MAETRLIDANALKKHITEIFETEEKIDKKWAMGLKYSLKIIDNAPTINIAEQNEYKTCKGCKYYLYRANEYPCSRCRRNNVLVDEIREQQNDRWKDGAHNV